MFKLISSAALRLLFILFISGQVEFINLLIHKLLLLSFSIIILSNKSFEEDILKVSRLKGKRVKIRKIRFNIYLILLLISYISIK